MVDQYLTLLVNKEQFTLNGVKLLNEKIKGVNNIGIIGFKYGSSGGGNIHFKNLIPYWELLGVKVSIVEPIIGDEFTFLSVLKATIKTLFLKIDNFYDISKCDIILSVSPYPMDFILSFLLSYKYNKPLAVYVHHITPSILIHPYRRGLFRVFLNVFYISGLITIFSRFKIPIFLDNPRTLNKKLMTVFPDFDAIPKNLEEDILVPKPAHMQYDICYIGRIEKHKGVEDIIRVADILVKKYFMAPKIILAGKGKEKYVAKIKKKIDKMGLSKYIQLKGYVTERDKFVLLINSKVFIFLSYEEGWSISVMEAASVGTPIVAYSLPAYYYLKGNYFSVPVGDVKACAEKLNQVINDYSLTKNIVAEAKECVDKFSYNFIAKQQLTFFKKILKDSSTENL